MEVGGYPKKKQDWLECPGSLGGREGPLPSQSVLGHPQSHAPQCLGPGLVGVISSQTVALGSPAQVDVKGRHRPCPQKVLLCLECGWGCRG